MLWKIIEIKQNNNGEIKPCLIIIIKLNLILKFLFIKKIIKINLIWIIEEKAIKDFISTWINLDINLKKILKILIKKNK